jgi:hypothetical protein
MKSKKKKQNGLAMDLIAKSTQLTLEQVEEYLKYQKNK